VRVRSQPGYDHSYYFVWHWPFLTHMSPGSVMLAGFYFRIGSYSLWVAIV
jgi:hypothetical protein